MDTVGVPKSGRDTSVVKSVKKPPDLVEKEEEMQKQSHEIQGNKEERA